MALKCLLKLLSDSIEKNNIELFPPPTALAMLCYLLVAYRNVHIEVFVDVSLISHFLHVFPCGQLNYSGGRRRRKISKTSVYPS